MNSNVKSIVLDGAECIRFTIKNDTYLHVVGNYFRNSLKHPNILRKCLFHRIIFYVWCRKFQSLIVPFGRGCKWRRSSWSISTDVKRVAAEITITHLRKPILRFTYCHLPLGRFSQCLHNFSLRFQAIQSKCT